MASKSPLKKIAKNGSHPMQLRRTVRPTPVRSGSTDPYTVTMDLLTELMAQQPDAMAAVLRLMMSQDGSPQAALPSAPVAPVGSPPIPEGLPLSEEMLQEAEAAHPGGEVLGPVHGLDDQNDANALAAEDVQEAAQPEVEDCTDLIDDSAPTQLGPEFADVGSLLAEVRTLARGMGAADALKSKNK